MTGYTVLRAGDMRPETYGEAELTWMVSGALGSSTVLTVGRCRLEPGRSTTHHIHRTSDEVLYLLTGTIEFAGGGVTRIVEAGDIVSVPRGMDHVSRNVGETTAEMVIVYDTPDRELVLVEDRAE